VLLVRSSYLVILMISLSGVAIPAAPPIPIVKGEWPQDTLPAIFAEGQDPTAEFNDFGWRLFLAAAWPGDPLKKGEPDRLATLPDLKPPVWDGWAGVDELYLDGGARPLNWGDTGTRRPANLPPGDFPPTRVLSQLNQMGVGVPIGPLVAQNRTYTLYETRVNRTLYEFLRGADTAPASWRYLAKNLPKPDKPALDYPVGSICFKAAWRLFQLPAEQELMKRYHVMSAWVPTTQSPFWERRAVGLTGFHLIVRTAKRPEWLWFSFEHVDNLSVGSDAPAGTKPTYNNPAGPQWAFHPEVNQLPSAVFPVGPPAMSTSPTPVQVVRFSRIPASTRLANDAYQKHAVVRLTPWRHYSLIVAQWPRRRAMGGTFPGTAGFPFPDAPEAAERPIANSVLETSKNLQSGQSCMKCHAVRKTYGTGPLWFVSTRALTVTP